MNNDVYQRILEGAQIAHPLSPRALWRLSGPDAVRYLNGQVTCDVTTLVEDSARLAAVCTAKGRMEGALILARHGADLFLDAEPDLHESLGMRLEKYLIADDAAFEDLTDNWTLTHRFGSEPPKIAAPGFIVRHARYGVPGYDIWSPQPSAGFAGETADDETVEILRIEHAIPRWDFELTPQTLPPEAGPVMLRAISYTKGCYVGQETIARLKSIGHVNRTLVFLRTEGAAVPAKGARIVSGGKEVGVITSSGFSPRLQAGIALGYVLPALETPGTELLVADKAAVVHPPLPLAQ